MDPLLNPHVDPRKLLALKSSMTLHDWETQIRGKMLQLPDRVLYTWDRAVNERSVPDLGRITREFLTAWEGDRTRWDQLIAVDVQRFPWVAVGIFDVYRDPRTPGDAKTRLLWMVDEIALSAGDEVDVCRELAAKGYDGERCLVVTDASCEWQQLERDLIRQRPNYQGKGTNYILRENGFPHVVPPDRSAKANPGILERIRATNACIREGRAILGGKATIEVLNQALRSGSGAGDHLHPGIVSLSNSEISKAITAGTLTSDTGGPGSFALGQVHADRAHKLSLADARRIGNVFRRDLGREYQAISELAERDRRPLTMWVRQRLEDAVAAARAASTTGAGTRSGEPPEASLAHRGRWQAHRGVPCRSSDTSRYAGSRGSAATTAREAAEIEEPFGYGRAGRPSRRGASRLRGRRRGDTAMSLLNCW